MIRAIGLGRVCSEPRYKEISKEGGTLTFRLKVDSKAGTCFYNCSYWLSRDDKIIDLLKENNVVYLEGFWNTYSERKTDGSWLNLNTFRIQTLKMFTNTGEELCCPKPSFSPKEET